MPRPRAPTRSPTGQRKGNPVAERLPHNDNVRISPLLGRKAMQILTTLDNAQRRVDEVRNRFTRTADY